MNTFRFQGLLHTKLYSIITLLITHTGINAFSVHEHLFDGLIKELQCSKSFTTSNLSLFLLYLFDLAWYSNCDVHKLFNVGLGELREGCVCRDKKRANKQCNKKMKSVKRRSVAFCLIFHIMSVACA